MARLRNASPGNPSGAYVRLFDDEALGELASKIQSAVISSGSELERIIRKKAPNIPDLDAVLEQSIVPDGVRLAHKRQIQRSRILNLAGSEPDFMVFERHGGTQTCHIIELKDGHVFDTKKVDAERRSMVSTHPPTDDEDRPASCQPEHAPPVIGRERVKGTRENAGSEPVRKNDSSSVGGE